VNGTDGDLVLVAPPFIVSEDEIDQIVQRLGDAITATARQVMVRT
jgi:adenosylmethionine-8-amino-7-oxononanoate aminotransferase